MEAPLGAQGGKGDLDAVALGDGRCAIAVGHDAAGRVIAQPREAVKGPHFLPECLLVKLAAVLPELRFVGSGEDAGSAVAGKEEVDEAEVVLDAPALVDFPGVVDLDPEFGAVERAHVASDPELDAAVLSLPHVRGHELGAVVEGATALPAADIRSEGPFLDPGEVVGHLVVGLIGLRGGRPGVPVGRLAEQPLVGDVLDGGPLFEGDPEEPKDVGGLIRLFHSSLGARRAARRVLRVALAGLFAGASVFSHKGLFKSF